MLSMPLPLVRVMTLYQLYSMYKDFETLYRAYTWIVYGYGFAKWVVGYRNVPQIEERFLVVDVEGGELDLIEPSEISQS